MQSHSVAGTGLSWFCIRRRAWLPFPNRAHRQTFHAKLQPGDARITCAASGVTDVLFYAAVIGLAQLQNTYPNYIQMRTEGYFCADREEESV